MERWRAAWQLIIERKELFFPLSLIYLALYIGAYFYIYNGEPLQFYGMFPAHYTLLFTLLTIVISILLGALLTIFITKVREARLKSAGLGVIGMLFGALGAGCPGCFFGLFPIVLGFFGIAGTLAILPFHGLEFQVLTALLLLASIWFLAKEIDLSCKIPQKKIK